MLPVFGGLRGPKAAGGHLWAFWSRSAASAWSAVSWRWRSCCGAANPRGRVQTFGGARTSSGKNSLLIAAPPPGSTWYRGVTRSGGHTRRRRAKMAQKTDCEPFSDHDGVVPDRAFPGPDASPDAPIVQPAQPSASEPRQRPPALPENPAASVRDYCSGVYTTQRRLIRAGQRHGD